jgi:hypothetical protein
MRNGDIYVPTLKVKKPKEFNLLPANATRFDAIYKVNFLIHTNLVAAFCCIYFFVCNIWMLYRSRTGFVNINPLLLVRFLGIL